MVRPRGEFEEKKIKVGNAGVNLSSRYWRVLGSGGVAATPCEWRLERGKRGAQHATLHMQDESKSTATRIINVTCLLCEPTLSCPT